MQRGFSILEVIITIFVIIVGIVGVYSLVPRIVAISFANKDKFIASQLAKEGMELTRNIRDSNWLEQIGNPANLWDEGLVSDCGGVCNCLSGCRIDYTMLGAPDPVLPVYSAAYLNIDGDGFYSYSASLTQTKFQRKITISKVLNQYLEVTVEVFWQPDNSVFTVKERLYNWR